MEWLTRNHIGIVGCEVATHVIGFFEIARTVGMELLGAHR